MTEPDFSDLSAVYVSCTLKPSPEPSHTEGLMQTSAAIMRAHGVSVDEVRAVDHDLAPGVWPDMREHGAASDGWPDLFHASTAPTSWPSTCGGCSTDRPAATGA